MDMTKWLTEKFQHPLVPLFFFMGALLVLLGVSNGIKLPWVDTTDLSASSRTAALVLGFLFCAFSVLLYYFPPRDLELQTFSPRNGNPGPLKADTVPAELLVDFPARRALLSPNQEKLLKYLVYCCFPNKYIGIDAIQLEFGQYSLSETFYRLEQLRLLGFLETRQTVKGVEGEEDDYGLSCAYRRALGDKGACLPVPKPVSGRSLRHAVRLHEDMPRQPGNKNMPS